MIYKIKRKVVGGFKRGSKIGFPTLNARLYKYDLKKISSGVWATWARINGILNLSVTFVGQAKSFPKNGNFIELHLIDFKLTNTPKFIEIIFIDKIRDAKKFKSINALQKQINSDINIAKNILNRHV